MESKELRILHWNANSVNSKNKNKIAKLTKLLQDSKVDVALINETCLKADNIITIPGYVIHRADFRSTKSVCRGLLVLVKEGTDHHTILSQDLASMCGLGVEVNTAGTRLRLFAVYRAPGNKLAVEDISALLDSPLPTLIAGDLNAKHKAWGCKKNDTIGKKLYEHAISKGYVIKGPNEPTFYPWQVGRTPEILDIMISNRFDDYSVTQTVLEDIGSDHRPVLLVLRFEPITDIVDLLEELSVSSNNKKPGRVPGGIDFDNLPTDTGLENKSKRKSKHGEECKKTNKNMNFANND